MNTPWPRSREVEKPKLTRKEQRTMFLLEARSHANTLRELADLYASLHSNERIPNAMRKGARFIEELTK